MINNNMLWSKMEINTVIGIKRDSIIFSFLKKKRYILLPDIESETSYVENVRKCPYYKEIPVALGIAIRYKTKSLLWRSFSDAWYLLDLPIVQLKFW